MDGTVEWHPLNLHPVVAPDPSARPSVRTGRRAGERQPSTAAAAAAATATATASSVSSSLFPIFLAPSPRANFGSYMQVAPGLEIGFLKKAQ
jgi:hypothetical protein